MGPSKRDSASRLAALAEEERRRILVRDILSHRDVHLHPLPERAAADEVAHFAAQLRRIPAMDGYFDPQHLSALRQFQSQAQHAFASLPSGGVLEVVVIPTLPEEASGFHIYTVFDPGDESDRGQCIGYGIWALERGRAPFGQAEAVRIAFDIFPPFREGRYRKVPFINHDIYNVTRRILMRYRPRRFLVDARTQIAQTRTGNPLKRAAYYLKRGYYPPDAKALADACLVRMSRGAHLSERMLQRLLRQTRAPFWIYPVGEYLRTSATQTASAADSDLNAPDPGRR